MVYLMDRILRSRETYEEYIMNKEQEHERDLVKSAQRETQLNRDIYQLRVQIQEKEREIERLNSMLGIFKETAEKIFLSTKKGQ